MPKHLLSIQALERKDIAIIPELQPKDWSGVASRFEEHFGWTYFYPVKAVMDDLIVGVGQIILFETSAWLGNIIVRETHQRQGIGRLITLQLVEMAKALSRNNLFLLATPQGQLLYEKLGFQTAGTHAFYRKETDNPITPVKHSAIQRADPHHFGQILSIDKTATGEDRSALLERYLAKAWVFESDLQTSIQGFYLPDLGEGLIVAGNANAGTALLAFRNQAQIVIPSENKAAVAYLETQGYTSFRTATLMYLGKNKKWIPSMIYSRIGGYAG